MCQYHLSIYNYNVTILCRGDIMIDFRKLTLEEIEKGYKIDNDDLVCIFCEEHFNQNEVFPINQRFYNATMAIKHHIQVEHGGVFNQLIHLDKKLTTLTENQKQTLSMLHESLNDKEIASTLDTSSVAIRNLRFNFKEKATQAKLFLALYNLANEDDKINDFIPMVNTATQVDDRYMSNEDDRLDVLNNFLYSKNPLKLKTIPRKEKYKIILLQEIANLFEFKKQYTEKEVNEILKNIFDDFVTLRRYLIEYGYFERSNDGSLYSKHS